MEQPSWDSPQIEWRRYAGELRQRLGEANRRADGAKVFELRAREAEARAAGAQERAARALDRFAGAWERSERWRGIALRVLAAKRRDAYMLNDLEELLREGDVPAAVDLLAERRAGIEAARARREANQ